MYYMQIIYLLCVFFFFLIIDWLKIWWNIFHYFPCYFRLYWVQWEENKIQSISLDGKDQRSLNLQGLDAAQPYDIAILQVSCYQIKGNMILFFIHAFSFNFIQFME